jgi:glycosyltransferase involved in cell wall biosynthesis
VRILLVHNYYQQAGGEDVVFRQDAELLRREGHEVVEYCRSNAEFGEPTLVGTIKIAKGTIWSSDSHRKIRTLLRRDKYDLAHVHNTFVRISPSIYWACHEASVPVVQTLHNYRMFCPNGVCFRNGHVCEECKEHSVLRGIRHACYRDSRAATATVAVMLAVHHWRQTWVQMVDRYIALSEFSRRKFHEAHLPPEKIIVKPNFIYPDPGIGDKPRRYALFVGRLSPEKGLGTLLSAWDRVHRSIPLRIAGDGPLRGELEAQATQRGLSNVSFYGRLESREVMSLMQGARFLVFPSECYENCPTSILEAFACGCPVIASDIGGMQELVDNGRTGLHFRAGRPSDLAEKVEWAWTHSEQTALMEREARGKFERKYTAETSYRTLIEIYRSVTSMPRSVPILPQGGSSEED